MLVGVCRVRLVRLRLPTNLADSGITGVLAGVKFKDGIKVTDDDNEMTPDRVAA